VHDESLITRLHGVALPPHDTRAHELRRSREERSRLAHVIGEPRLSRVGVDLRRVGVDLDEVTASEVRRVVERHLDGAQAAIKWAQPVWSIGKEPVCYAKAASKHVTFGFWRGASLPDPSGRLESSGSVMAHVKLRTPADVDERLFAAWLRAARSLVG
jgi:hypothetical protein